VCRIDRYLVFRVGDLRVFKEIYWRGGGLVDRWNGMG